jgi:hypothetical protein
MGFEKIGLKPVAGAVGPDEVVVGSATRIEAEEAQFVDPMSDMMVNRAMARSIATGVVEQPWSREALGRIEAEIGAGAADYVAMCKPGQDVRIEGIRDQAAGIEGGLKVVAKGPTRFDVTDMNQRSGAER